MKIASLQNISPVSVSHNPEILKKVLIKNGEVPNITQFSRAIIKPGQVASSHIHVDIYEVFLTESGNGEMKIEDEVVAIGPGICITIEPGEAHEVLNNGDGDLVILTLGILDRR
jgi:mannose-6-phosphate isomerase-like protein (cupin superfamily)